MASILKHLRSSTADKRPTASGLADGQIALNTASGTPAMFFKDSAGNIVKVGPAHIGTTAPNVSPAGSAGNSDGELWIDESLTTRGLKYYDGTAFINLTPSGTTSTVGLVELATDAETQAGTDNARVVTPSGLQSKISDSTSTTSSTTIASSTAVKSAFDLANAALPKTGGTLTGELLISPSGSLVFEGSSDDSFETTIAVTNPTADRTITFPNVTGNVVTTGDSGTITSTMILDDTIVNADINASAAIVDTKLDTIATADKVSLSALNIDGATDIGGALENGDLFIVDDGAGGTNRKAQAFRMAQLTYSGVTGDITVASGGTAAISAGVIVNADVNASAAIAGTKISPDFGSQTITTTGVVSAALGAAATPSLTFTGDLNTGIYSPGADQVAISTNGSGRLFITSAGDVCFGSQVGANNDGSGISIYDTSFPRLSLRNSTTGNTTANGSQLYLVGSDLYVTNNENANLIFRTNATERLRITSAGLVGVGTSSPSAGLHISTTGQTTSALDTSGNLNLLVSDTGTSAGNGGSIVFGFNTGAGKFAAIKGQVITGAGNSIGDLAFSTRNATGDSTLTERLRITYDGKVGIGSSTPGAILDVAPDANRNLQVQGKSGTTYGLEIKNGTANSGGEFHVTAASSGAVVVNRGTTEIARFNSTGLGIGSSSPDVLITAKQTNAGATGATLRLVNASTTVNSATKLAFTNTTSETGDSAAITAVRTASGQYMTFGIEGTEAVRIDESRRVGIGTTSPEDRLDLGSGYLRFKEAVGGTGTYGAIRAFNTLANTNPATSIRFIRDVANVGNDGAICFDTVNSERLRIDSSGRVGIGTTSPSGANLVIDTESNSGSGIRLIGKSANDGSEIDFYADNNSTRLGYIEYNNANTTLNSETNVPVRFFQNGGEAFRVDTSKRLLVGTSSSVESNALLQVVKASGTNVIHVSSSLGNGESCRVATLANSRVAVIGIYKHSGITNPCGYLALSEEDLTDSYYWTDNSGNFRVSNDGNNIGTTNGTVVGTQTSDERIKNILGPVEYALETIKQIEPVRYSLKSEPDVEKLGFVAQQIRPLIPQSVFDTNEHIEGEPEGAPTKLGMEYVALIPVLVNAIKELSAEVDVLKVQLQTQ